MTTLRPRLTTCMRSLVSLTALTATLSACAVGPNYVRPSAPLTPAFKEGPGPQTGWSPAQPMDAIQKGAWWSVFDDAVLDGLEKRVAINNQNVVAAEAAYRQARALTAADRASFFPTLSVSGSGQRSGSGGGSSGTGAGTVVGGTTTTGTSTGATTTTGTTTVVGGGRSVTTYNATADASQGERTFGAKNPGWPCSTVIIDDQRLWALRRSSPSGRNPHTGRSVTVRQKSRSASSRSSLALPAISAALIAPIETPAIQSGSSPASCRPSYTPA